MFSKYVIQMRSSLHWPYALCNKLHPLGHVVTLSDICGDRRFVIFQWIWAKNTLYM